MNETNPFDSPHAKLNEPEKKKWRPTVVEIGVTCVLFAILAGLLLPATTSSPRTGSRIGTSMNHLKQIGLALHNYHDTHGSLPPAVVTDADGRPLYSWRVLLLPMLEQKPLFDEFDLSQPWDSPTNRPLVAQMPSAYESPFLSVADMPGMTTYLAVVDPDARQTIMLPRSGRALSQVPGTLGEATLVVEQIPASPVIWTKPVDVSPFELIRAAKIDQNDDSACIVLLGDAAVKWIALSDPQQLKASLFCEAADRADPMPAGD
ncbi:DUF1559 domain-containing protein [Bremerella sp. JC770]|uniref:DUF1559 family PulG-like putative transporter n=1 Tax=Bremerella sp. JC770 TaxID=3232137 RepID=UPI00345A2580